MSAANDVDQPLPLRAQLLGSVRLAVGDRPIPEGAWPRRTARSLLLLLLATPGHRLPRDRVLDLLWPAAAPATARNALYLALAALRRVLEPGLRAGRASAYVAVEGEVIGLRADPAPWVDADAFEAALAARAASAAARRESLRAALALYGGDLLADEPYADWPAARREELREARRRAALELADLELAAGRPADAVAPLEALLAADPTDEAAHRALMQAHAAAGRRAEALRQYERCRRALADELGVGPSPETEALVATLAAPAGAPAASSIPARTAAADRVDALPVPLTPLVGRAREVEAIQDLLWCPEVRLVTLTGPGGIGKTRLALEAARQVAADFADGVGFVPLAPVRDPALVLPTVARALGVEEAGGRPIAELLREALRGREQLLVLDNVEQVIDAAPEVTGLLEAAPRLKALVTSREALHVRGEHALPTPPLALPGAGARGAEAVARYEAVALFAARARAVAPGFALTDDNAATVAAICARLEGLPLAIELAAARVQDLPLEELLAGLAWRLRVLTGGYRDLPARQRTMRDAIAWSHDLLSEEEQALFRRLAVFAGGCTTESAEAVAAAGQLDDVPGLVGSLAEKHLVCREATDDGPRLTMLETVREYGLERLAASGEEAATRGAHAACYLALAERAEPELTGPEQAAWLDRLETEHDNLRAALAWTLDHDPSAAARLVGALWRFWWIRGYLSEGRAWAEAAVARGGGAVTERARALHAAGDLAQEQGDFDRATPLLEAGLAAARAAGERTVAVRCLTALGQIARDRGAYARATELHAEALTLCRAAVDRRGAAVALANLGGLAQMQGDYERAEAFYAEAAAALGAAGDRRNEATALSAMADVAVKRGDPERARRLAEDALARFRELGEWPGTAIVLTTLGDAARGQGDLAGAAARYEEALALFRAQGNLRLAAVALQNLGAIALDAGEAGRALALLGESLGLLRPSGDKENVAAALEVTARAIAALGKPCGATRLLGAAEALRESIGAPRPPGEEERHRGVLAEVRAGLGETAFAAAWESGRALALDEAIAEALAFTDDLA